MFPQRQRINSREFKIILKKGQKKFSPFFRARFVNEVPTAKVAVVIPKKIIKKRYERNRLKRRISHMGKKLVLNHTEPVHTIIWLQKPIENLSNQEILSELKKIL